MSSLQFPTRLVGRADAMFLSRKSKELAAQAEQEQAAQREKAAADLHELKQRAHNANRRIDDRVRRNHISEAVAMMIQGARG